MPPSAPPPDGDALAIRREGECGTGLPADLRRETGRELQQADAGAHFQEGDFAIPVRHGEDARTPRDARPRCQSRLLPVRMRAMEVSD